MNREDYERDLKQRQEEHLRSIRGGQNDPFWRPCLHDGCPECVGTGIRRDGSLCVHGISCPCPKCSPRCVSGTSTTGLTPPEFKTKPQTWNTTSDTKLTPADISGDALLFAGARTTLGCDKCAGQVQG